MPLLLRFEPKVSTHADMECPGSLDSGHAHFLRHLGSRWSIRRNDYGKDHIAVQFLRFTGKAMKSQVGTPPTRRDVKEALQARWTVFGMLQAAGPGIRSKRLSFTLHA
jgi:hypothetical protein